MVLSGASLTASAEPLKIEAAKPANGVFVTYGYHSTVLELKDGKFRYWFSSDVVDEKLKYPLEGTYTTEGDTISLKNENIFPPEVDWTAKSVDGVLTLWRSDALKILAAGKLDLYGSGGKANFLLQGGGSIIVPTKRTAEEAWKSPPERVLTGTEGLVEPQKPKAEKSKEGDPPPASTPAEPGKE